MGVQKITFDGANVTAKVDADLYHYLFSEDIGLLKGLGHDCAFTLANNTITFLDGYVSVYGRIIYLESGTAVPVVPDSTKFGYVILAVDTTANSVALYTKELAGSYPPRTVTNLLEAAGLYEFVLCAYAKTTTSVTLNTVYERSMIVNDKERIADLEATLRNNYYPRAIALTKVQNGVYQFTGTSSVELGQSLLIATIGFTSVVVFPGELLFRVIGSVASVSYRYAGGDYSLTVSYSNNIATLTCGSTTHKITSLILKK